MFGGTVSVCVFSDKRAVILGSQALWGKQMYKNMYTLMWQHSTDLFKERVRNTEQW